MCVAPTAARTSASPYGDARGGRSCASTNAISGSIGAVFPRTRIGQGDARRTVDENSGATIVRPPEGSAHFHPSMRSPISAVTQYCNASAASTSAGRASS